MLDRDVGQKSVNNFNIHIGFTDDEIEKEKNRNKAQVHMLRDQLKYGQCGCQTPVRPTCSGAAPGPCACNCNGAAGKRVFGLDPTGAVPHSQDMKDTGVSEQETVDYSENLHIFPMAQLSEGNAWLQPSSNQLIKGFMRPGDSFKADAIKELEMATGPWTSLTEPIEMKTAGLSMMCPPNSFMCDLQFNTNGEGSEINGFKCCTAKNGQADYGYNECKPVELEETPFGSRLSNSKSRYWGKCDLQGFFLTGIMVKTLKSDTKQREDYISTWKELNCCSLKLKTSS